MLGRMLSLVYLTVFSSLNSGIKLYTQSALGFKLSNYITAVQYPSIEAKAEGMPHVFGSGNNFSLACSRYAFSIILFQFRLESHRTGYGYERSFRGDWPLEMNASPSWRHRRAFPRGLRRFPARSQPRSRMMNSPLASRHAFS